MRQENLAELLRLEEESAAEERRQLAEAAAMQEAVRLEHEEAERQRQLHAQSHGNFAASEFFVGGPFDQSNQGSGSFEPHGSQGGMEMGFLNELFEAANGAEATMQQDMVIHSNSAPNGQDVGAIQTQ